MTCTLSPRLKITKAGQISVPADVRRRWDTSFVSAEDHGDHLVLRPAPADPVDAVQGIFAEETRGEPSSEQLRKQEREADAEAEEQKWKPTR